MTRDTDILPTCTIVETSPNAYVLLASGLTIRHAHQVGIVSYHTSLPAALFAAEVFLYHENDPVNYASDPTTYALPDDPRPPPPSINITVSDRAWAYIKEQTRKHDYNGTAPYQGIGSYLIALFTANPRWQDWQDTRHNYPQDFGDNIDALDRDRAAKGQLPIWAQYETGKRTRHPRTFPLEKLNRLHPLVLPIARHYCIAPYRGGDRLAPHLQVTATIEAYGLNYLTPRNTPQPPPVAHKWPNRAGHRKSNPGGIAF